jgi:hypothetical protein
MAERKASSTASGSGDPGKGASGAVGSGDMRRQRGIVACETSQERARPIFAPDLPIERQLEKRLIDGFARWARPTLRAFKRPETGVGWGCYATHHFHHR